MTARPKFQDHPRRCGENYVKNFMGYSTVGSPPQVRGKLPLLTAARYFLRITPAGAGKTLLSRIDFSRFRDHPRRCGENAMSVPPGLVFVGSPPQVRGKQTYMGYSFFNNRITPAGAGKTLKIG